MKLFLFLSLLASAFSFKILIYSPKFGASHVSFIGKIADILVQEGFDVTLVMPEMSPWINSNGTKLAIVIPIEPDTRVTAMVSDDSALGALWRPGPGSSGFTAVRQMLDLVRIAHAYQCETNLRQNDLLANLKNQKFDLGVSEVFDLCGLAMFEEIGLENHVLLQTALMPESVAEAFGVPNLPALVPSYFSDTPMTMTYMERAVNLLKSRFGVWRMDALKDSIETAYHTVMGRKVDLWKKMTEASFVFTNTDPLIDFPRAISERVVNIGGISVPKPKPLDAYWEELVTKREATVLLSFGSVAQSYTMPAEMKKALLETFKRFPKVTFIWKYEKDEDNVADGIPNVVTNKWVPQNDLLNHPNLKLFITHAGMNSILESAQRGVPMLTIPLFGDQLRNAQTIKRFGISTVFDKHDLHNPNVLEQNIREILGNESYRNNATRLAKMMANRPRDQRDQVVKYIRFAAEFGSLPEYHIPHVSFVQYYTLDIIIHLLTVSVMFSTTILYVIVKILAKLTTSKMKTA